VTIIIMMKIIIMVTEDQGRVKECSNVFSQTGAPHFRGLAAKNVGVKVAYQ